MAAAKLPRSRSLRRSCAHRLQPLVRPLPSQMQRCKHELAVRESESGLHKYGRHSLMEGPAARYQFWPSMARDTPLLYFCAQAILAASSNATTFNERMHSSAGRIFSDLRNSLKPSSVENLTLALFYVLKWVKEKMRQRREELERENLALEAGAEEGEDDEEEEEE